MANVIRMADVLGRRVSSGPHDAIVLVAHMLCVRPQGVLVGCHKACIERSTQNDEVGDRNKITPEQLADAPEIFQL